MKCLQEEKHAQRTKNQTIQLWAMCLLHYGSNTEHSNTDEKEILVLLCPYSYSPYPSVQCAVNRGECMWGGFICSSLRRNSISCCWLCPPHISCLAFYSVASTYTNLLCQVLIMTLNKQFITYIFPPTLVLSSLWSIGNNKVTDWLNVLLQDYEGEKIPGFRHSLSIEELYVPVGNIHAVVSGFRKARFSLHFGGQVSGP